MPPKAIPSSINKFISAFLILIGLALLPFIGKAVGYFPLDLSTVFRVYLACASILIIAIGVRLIFPANGSFAKMMDAIIIILICLGLGELTAVLFFHHTNGYWSFDLKPNTNAPLYDYHPYMVGVNEPNASHSIDSILYTHNSLGWRDIEYSKAKSEESVRIAVIGGSTTYGVGVQDDKPWPNLLDQEGETRQIEVLNFGIPGHSSMEHLIFTATQLSEWQPDIAVFYMGLNDLRSANIAGLRHDYSDFHAKTLYGGLGLCDYEQIPAIALLREALIILQYIGWLEPCPNQTVRTEADPNWGYQESLSIYERNIREIIALCEVLECEVIMIPQVVHEEAIASADISWWMPFLTVEQIADYLEVYNNKMIEVCSEEGVLCLDTVLAVDWQFEDFVDYTHFSVTGNERFAYVIRPGLFGMADSLR